MGSEDGEPIGRQAPFPPEMQGRWVEESDPSLVVVISGSEMTWRGEGRDYLDKRLTADEGGALCVTLEFADQIDSGDSINLVAWPDGAMHAFSDHFVALFERANA